MQIWYDSKMLSSQWDSNNQHFVYVIVSWFLLGIITRQGFLFPCSCMNRCTCCLKYNDFKCIDYHTSQPGGNVPPFPKTKSAVVCNLYKCNLHIEYWPMVNTQFVVWFKRHIPMANMKVWSRKAFVWEGKYVAVQMASPRMAVIIIPSKKEITFCYHGNEFHKIMREISRKGGWRGRGNYSFFATTTIRATIYWNLSKHLAPICYVNKMIASASWTGVWVTKRISYVPLFYIIFQHCHNKCWPLHIKFVFVRCGMVPAKYQCDSNNLRGTLKDQKVCFRRN